MTYAARASTLPPTLQQMEDRDRTVTRSPPTLLQDGWHAAPYSPKSHLSRPRREAIVHQPLLRLTRETPCLFVVCVSTCEAGHLIPILHVGKALAQRGHNVKLATHACAGEKFASACAEAGLDFIGLVEDVKEADSGHGKAAVLQNEGKMMSTFKYYNDCLREPLSRYLNACRPDVIVADFVTPCAWEVADEQGIPVVLNVPGPLCFLTAMTPLTGWRQYLQHLRISREEASAVYELFQKIYHASFSRICLVNSFFGLEPPQSVRSNFRITGSTAARETLRNHETSNADFNTWLEWVRSEGLRIVYVTMGSMQKLKDFQVKAIYGGLADIPACAVAWSLTEDQHVFLPGGTSCGLPKKFYIRKWLPQSEALQLPDVALVISHCGFGGLNEIIAAGKPLVATPFRVDQPANAAAALERGLGEVLKTNALSAYSVKRAVLKCLTDPSYLRCARELQSSLLKTRGAEACADEVEIFAKHSAHELVTSPPSVVSQFLRSAAPLSIFGAGIGAAFTISRAIRWQWFEGTSQMRGC